MSQGMLAFFFVVAVHEHENRVREKQKKELYTSLCFQKSIPKLNAEVPVVSGGGSLFGALTLNAPESLLRTFAWESLTSKGLVLGIHSTLLDLALLYLPHLSPLTIGVTSLLTKKLHIWLMLAG